MARPAKPVFAQTGNGAGKSQRMEKENKFRSQSLPKPPKHLTDAQKKIFRFIVNESAKSGTLCSLDNYVLEEAAVSIDRLQMCNKLANEDPLNKDILKVITDYSKIFFRCCNELSLSPQARAKMAIAAAQDDGTETLKKILSGDDLDDL